MSSTCHPLSTSDASCACQDLVLLDRFRDCFKTSCSRKDDLSALKITLDTCKDFKTRNRSKSYRSLIIAFYSLAIVAMAIQWLARSTIGRLRWLDDSNMVVILFLDTVLFATCLKMSYTGLGQDMWDVSFPNITTTLLVSRSINSQKFHLTCHCSTSGSARLSTSLPSASSNSLFYSSSCKSFQTSASDT